MDWYGRDLAAVFAALEAGPDGLDGATARERLARIGRNELQEKPPVPPWRMFLRQFSDFMVLVLVAAAVVSGLIGEPADTAIILVIVVLNAILGFVQEYRAERAMEALRRMAALQARVLRDGTVSVVPAADLVPGDLVLLEAGTAVPADLRLTEVHALRTDESALTGESVPVDKRTDTIPGSDVPVADRLNMAFKGTTVTHGRARGVVVSTGMQTEMGGIAGMLQAEGTITPLQRRMATFGRQLSYIILLICAILLGTGILRGEEPMRMLLLSISLAVAAIPEALPALITLTLAFGARRMARKHSLVRRLPAVETLGAVSHICTDKTGTLTQNRMRVLGTRGSVGDASLRPGLPVLELAMALNHDVKRRSDGGWDGDPTEVALVQHVEEHIGAGSVAGLGRDFPRSAETPFDADRKCMTTVHDAGERHLVVTKGAVESVAAFLADAAERDEALREAHRLAADGVRVLAYACLVLDAGQPYRDEVQLQGRMTLAGLAWMADPPRAEVAEAIAECNAAGIRTVMITGDHPATASAIARQLGILGEGDDGTLTGRELDRLDEEAFARKVDHVRVYARVSPGQKLRIVKALQRQGHAVAMTGDGVNDAPSLKAADIGVAMGITGTDVSKEAAQLILLDDRFPTIVGAVREGRRIYDNIRRFVRYIMACNVAEIWTIVLAPFLGLPVPLQPIHLLWINLVTDGLPGLALANEHAEKDVMSRPPRRQDESLFADGLGFHVAWVGLLMAGITLAAQAWTLANDFGHWQTMVFCILAFSQLGHVMAIRSERRYLFEQGLLSNTPLLGAVLLTIGLQLAVVYSPLGNTLFHTEPLEARELAFCLAVSLLPFHAVEFEKFVRRRLARRRKP
jgi:Ca2+-transporting ATPase